ncbi:EAL domain-containing protein [Roseomonas sp. PWR1]|uniref:EAL domain-containing protein n=1 Tax=Roseomonas nitratireducens TaxID=2820810 RepID=A0ABS4AT89_9PROT|nr:EAL domain-containing protein [Neoroseomonas nitratireducens]MBP0464574.1 EAL domain-containing protein [Neoroseomonas nitratireducens]
MTYAAKLSPAATDAGEPLGPIDETTGLLRREAFLGALDRRARQEEKRPFALLAIDLDRFKAVNDSLGHPIGDALLRAVGRRLRSCIRAGDLAGRLGGDEFAILLPDQGREEDAEALAARLVDLLSRPFLLEGHSAVIGASVGIAIFPEDADDADRLMRAADLALYAAKEQGRGLVRRYAPEMRARMEERRRLEADLRAAIGLGQFELHFQPQVSIAGGALTGFEALLRWRHPERGLVPPAAFVPLAEEIGLIVPIGEWVLRTACREATTWPEALHVAVNVAAPQFAQRDLFDVVAAALADSGLPAHRLELEVTETSLLHDTTRAIETCQRLRTLGVRISLDDFGTGYSSLTQLRDFPLDRVKIDRSFIAEIGTRGDSAAIVRAVTALGAALGLRTTAEGVETPEQLAELLAYGCSEAQGYLVSRPVPRDQVQEMIARLAQGQETAA